MDDQRTHEALVDVASGTPGATKAAATPGGAAGDRPSAADGVAHLRRRVPRAAYSTPVRVVGHHGVLEGRIEDVSTRGVLIVANRALEPGDVVQLRFALPGSGETAQCAAVLRWVRLAPSSQRAAMGFEFQVPPTVLRAAVEAYVSERGSLPDARDATRR